MAQHSYDPIAELDEAIDITLTSRDLNKTDSPVSTLMRMYIEGEISMDECDAGEIVAVIARLANAQGGKPTTTVGYPMRGPASSDGKRAWGVAMRPRAQVAKLLEEALAAIKNDRRRQAVVRLLVNREPVEDTPAQLTAGLADLAQYFWPISRKVHISNGITLAGGNDATPERLAKAEETMVDKAGARWIVDGFERMFLRGQLDDDPEVNDILHAAGLRYQEEHFRAGLTPLGAIDYSREWVDGTGQLAMSERMEMFRQRFRSARKAMGERYASIVDAVVIEGQTLRDVGLAKTRYRQKDAMTAAAGERLNAGLRLLARHYHRGGREKLEDEPTRTWNRASERQRRAYPASLI